MDVEDARPDPDRLLSRIRAEEESARRGRLKVFFGFAAGVGKTFSMLEEAQALKARGRDVVVGYVEPHGRRDTEALLSGLERIAPRNVGHRGLDLLEMDLDAILARRPELVLVDELAHSNAPGSRHPKRWQDVVELLDAGIDVFSTLNVQHLESLNDVVAQITGVMVRETLPDSVVDEADEVELVDLPPDDLLERLRLGKIYVPGAIEEAIRNFFRKPNLVALRELALRRVAERVNAQMLLERRQAAPGIPWATTERVLLCVDHTPGAARVVRAGKRLAAALRAPWIVATVDTPRTQRLSVAARKRLAGHLTLAESLGATTVTLSGPAVAEEILSYASEQNVTKIVVGAPRWPRWARIIAPSTTDTLLAKAEKIEIVVVRGSPEGLEPPEDETRGLAMPNARALRQAGLAVVVSTGLAGLMHAFDLAEANLIMVYLLGVAFVAARYGRAAAATAAVLSVLAFDFLFVPPQLTFAVSDTQYLITFTIMLAIGLLIGTLTVRIREQVLASRERERRTEALYEMSRHLSVTTGTVTLLHVAMMQLAKVFGTNLTILRPDAQGRLQSPPGTPPGFFGQDSERGVAEWVLAHGEPAGADTDTLPGARALYLPLQASQGVTGVLAIQPPAGVRLGSPEQRRLLQTMANQIALALERDALSDVAQRASVDAAAERLRSSLLSSVSHDLRTPLAVIAGASSALLDPTAVRDEKARRALVESIHQQAERLGRLIRNLLDMTRLESGTLTPQRQWMPVEEIVGSALRMAQTELGSRPVTTQLPADLPLVNVDGILIEQLLINLFDNASHHAPPDAAVEVSARVEGDRQLLLEVADRGPGIREEDLPRVFDRFWRGPAQRQGGVGLGLAICKAIAEAHGGSIEAGNRDGGGAAFRVRLPIIGEPPAVLTEASCG